MHSTYRGKDIKIAIVDSGIDSSHEVLKGAFVYNLIPGTEDKIGHGTAVASIIHKLIPMAEIYDYALFENTTEVSVDDLIGCLEHLKNNHHFDIIHLSSGVLQSESISLLKNICNEITDSGTIIVSAYDNAGGISYPALFDNVIGVDWCDKCSNGLQYIWVENSPINILGIGSLQRLPWVNNSFNYVGGSSFAAPYITALVARLIEKGLASFKDITRSLREEAHIIVEIPVHKKRKSDDYRLKIKKAIIFPFNKEMHSLFRFEHMLDFEIVGLYEPPRLRRTKQRVSDLLEINCRDVAIDSDKNINWSTSDFDTVILGHTEIIAKNLGANYIELFLQNCINFKKNIYCFDSLRGYESLIERLQDQGNTAFYPHVTEDDAPNHLLGKLYAMSTPIVGIFGTSPKQGKFSLQLGLKRCLSQKGYKLGFLGTEPSSILFGFDEVYPMGYESTVSVSGAKAVAVINEMMHRIDEKNYDLIIVGSQSQSIPYNTGNIGFYPLAQHEFLLGVEPDTIILCINPFDEVDYLRRTISYFKSYLDINVIALVMFPLHRSFEWAISGSSFESVLSPVLLEQIELYKQEFNIPCYLAGEEKEIENLAEKIINFFSNEA